MLGELLTLSFVRTAILAPVPNVQLGATRRQ